MGLTAPILAFATSLSPRSWVDLIVAFGAVVLTYVATSRIIKQAGYSTWWILLPLSPLVLTVVCFAILWHDLNAIVFGGSFGFFGINSIGLFWHLDQLSFFLNWLFYIVFAFSRWPTAGARRPSEMNAPRPSGPDHGPVTGPASGSAAPRAPVPVARVASEARAAPAQATGVTTAPAPPRASTKFCAWCGESLPGNRALFHDCGPKDRPETHCRACGTALPPGATHCSSCAAV
jgi:hypothetical protein